MDKVVTQLQQGLREGTTSTDLTKGMGSSLSKLIDKFKREYSQFSNLTKNGTIDFSRSEEGIKAGKRLIETFEELQRVMGDLSTKSVIDLKKMFPEAFDSRIDDLRNSMSSLLRDLDTLASKRITQAGLETDINSLNTKIQALRDQLIEESVIKIKTDEADVAKATVEELTGKIEELRKKLGQELELKTTTNTSELEKLNKEASAIQERIKASEKNFSADGKKYKGKTQKEWDSSSESGQAKAGAARAFENRARDLKRQREIKSEQQELKRERTALIKANESFYKKEDLSKTAQDMGKSADEISKITQLHKDQADAIERSKQATAELNQMQTSNKNTKAALDSENAALQQKTERYTILNKQISELESKTNAIDIGKRFKEVAPNFDFSPELLKSEQGLQTLYIELSKIEAVQADKLIQDLSQFGLNAEQARAAVEGLRSGIENMTLQAHEMKRAEQDMKNLTNRMLYFFSTTNQIQLFKRAVRSAMNTIKELDQTMAEAAVVTKYSIEDMWGKMPEYSRTAQQLGISINGMYQATTLYYQQGLRTNEAMQLGIETMKMARIAGLESADATEAMTSALRGFNMELSKASAERINDVYSQLAATSASNVQQISTAMEKTASIASAANMEFETTAAFLAQIIETTQEAPETAGTALKTIIARFSEVKSLRDQGTLIGEDSEGEGIDVNGIQTALRSVGISMEGFFAGTEGLDSTLLKLAEKWNTLDFETQRYIATMAAGSRQQSRFIAMMSDYGRTQELVAEANESAGASQRQFNKTMESLEAKVQKLKNAWNEFLMNLANSEIVKWAVDFLATILTAVNKLSGGIKNGLAKSILSLVMAFSALKAGLKVASLASYAIEKKMMLKPTIGEEQARGSQNGQAYGRAWVSAVNSQVSQMNEKRRITGARSGAGIYTGTPSSRPHPQAPKAPPSEGSKGDNTSSATKGVMAFNGQVREANRGTSQLEKSTQTAQAGLSKLSGGFFAAGGACMAFSAILSMMGLDEAAEAATTLGVVFVGLGGAVSLFSSVVSMTSSVMAAMGEEGLAAGLSIKLGMDMAQASVWWLLLIAMAVTVVFIGLAAALIGIVILVKKTVEAMKKNSLKGQIEKLSEKITDLGDVAEEAKNKIEELSESREQLNEMGKTFENLVKGSSEWRDALIENNEKVLSLLDNYPKLIDYIKRGADGRLELSGEGIDAAIESQQLAYLNAVNAKTLASQQQQRKTLELETADYLAEAWAKTDGSNWGGAFSGYLTGAGIVATNPQTLLTGTWLPIMAAGGIIGAVDNRYQQGVFEQTEWYGEVLQGVFDGVGGSIEEAASKIGVTKEANDLNNRIMAFTGKAFDWYANIFEEARTGGLSYEQFNKLAAEMAERGIDEQDRDKVEELYNLLGFDEIADFSSVYEQIENLEGNFKKLSESAQQLETAERTRLLSIAEQNAASSTYVSGSKYSDIAVDMATSMYDDYDAKVEEAAKKYSYSEVSKYGVYDRANREIISQYATLQGMEEDAVRAKVEAKELSYETMANVLANNDVSKEQVKTMEKLVKTLTTLEKTLTKDQLDTVTGLMTDNGLGLTQADIDSINESGGVEAYFKKILTDEDLKNMDYVDAEGNADWDSFLKEATLRYSKGDDAFKYAKQIAQTYVENGEEWLNEATSDALSKGVKLSAGQTQGIANVIKNIATRGGDAEQFIEKFPQLVGNLTGEKLEQAYTIIAEADWKTTGGIDAAIAALKNLGSEIDTSLTQELYALSNALKKIDIASIRAKLGSFNETLEMVKDKAEKGERTFTLEERDKLISAGMDESRFVAIGFDKWVSLDSTNDLLAAIEGNTFKMLDDSQKTLDEQIAQGEIIGQAMENTYEVGDGTEGSVTGETRTGEQLIRELKEGTRDALGEGTTNNVSRGVLEQLAQDMGYTSKDYEKLSDKGLIAFVTTAYDELYGESGVALLEKKNTKEQTKKQEETIRISMIAGTAEVYDDAAGLSVVETVLDGLISAESGLGVAVERVARSLNDQFSAFAYSVASVKNLVVATSKSNDKLAALGKTISDNSGILENASEDSWDYGAALENIALAAKSVFGDKVDPDFVDTHRKLFVDLAKGGEVAQQALMQLSEYYTEKFLQNKNVDFDEVKTALSGVFDGIDPGEAIDLNSYYTKLMKIEGMTEEVAKSILQTWGFAVVTSKEWSTDAAGNIVAGSIAGIRLDANQLLEGAAGEKWENPYDKFYNIYEKINGLMREREKIERRYDRLLRDRNVSGKDLVDNSKKELENLKNQAKLQKYLRQGKSNEIDQVLAENQSLVSAYSVTLDKETGVINFDREAVKKIEGTATGEAFEKLISKLEGLRDQYQETEDAVEEIEDAIYENKTRYKDDYFDMEDRIKEAVLADRQSQIEALQNINDSINDANSKMLEAMQAQIQAYRQSRDNEKAEKEITDKQARLAYLQQDTSGANATEILALEKEIAEAQENHIDNLIDQKITELQEQNDKAAEQRERQIDIMDAQLEQYEKTGQVWDDVEELWRTGVTSDGKLMTDSRLSKLLAESEGLQGMSKLGSEQWTKDLVASIAKAYAHLENQSLDTDDEGEDDSPPPENEEPSGEGAEAGKLTEDQVAWLQNKLIQFGYTISPDEIGKYQGNTKNAVKQYLASTGVFTGEKEDAYRTLMNGETAGLKYSTITGKNSNGVVSDAYAKFDAGKTDEVLTYNHVPYRAVKDRNGVSWISGNPMGGALGTIYYNNKFHKIDAFKTGGLADYTGPAWLDGTKSKPELVLNARDTQNFIQLKDILASLMGNAPSKSSEKAGETTYDIDINVETIKDETDLDMIANYIENKIVASANYRNNTIIGGRR